MPNLDYSMPRKQMAEWKRETIKLIVWRWLFCVALTLLIVPNVYWVPWQGIAIIVAGVNGILAVVSCGVIAYLYFVEKD